MTTDKHIVLLNISELVELDKGDRRIALRKMGAGIGDVKYNIVMDAIRKYYN